MIRFQQKFTKKNFFIQAKQHKTHFFQIYQILRDPFTKGAITRFPNAGSMAIFFWWFYMV